MKEPQIRFSTSLVPCSDGKGKALVEIMLTPWGIVECTNGAFIVDEISAALSISAFQAGKKDIPIDFEHASVRGPFSTPDGRAPAAGWITEILAKPGEGLFALVKWNEDAKEMIQKDQYRYLSPVLRLSDDRKVLSVLSAALTNTPAIVDMQRIAAKYTGIPEGDALMDLKALKTALISAGVTLADNVEDAAVLTATVDFLMKMKASQKASQGDSALVASMRTKLGIAADATTEVLIAKIGDLVTQRVPTEDYVKLTARMEAMTAKETEREADCLVAKAVADGKANPNDKDFMLWVKDLAKTPEAFSRWEKFSPKVVPVGKVITPAAMDGIANDRPAQILALKAEYKGSKMLNSGGLRLDSYVNTCLKKENLEPLNADEKKALWVG